MSVEEVIQAIEGVRSEATWRAMSLEDLEGNLVLPFLRLDDDEDYGTVVQSLSNHAYDMWRKKLWTAQDIPQEEDGYNRSMNVMIALKRSLLMRIPIVEDRESRANLTQQLARISLILNPVLLAHALRGEQQDDGADEGNVSTASEESN